MPILCIHKSTYKSTLKIFARESNHEQKEHQFSAKILNPFTIIFFCSLLKALHWIGKTPELSPPNNIMKVT